MARPRVIEPDPLTVEVTITFFIRERDNEYRRYLEKHRERGHSVENLISAASRVGLRVIGQYRYDDMAPTERADQRVLFVAQKL